MGRWDDIYSSHESCVRAVSAFYAADDEVAFFSEVFAQTHW